MVSMKKDAWWDNEIGGERKKKVHIKYWEVFSAKNERERDT